MSISAVILAGGLSRRMHGVEKGLVHLNQKPLIAYIIDVIKDEVDGIFINANQRIDLWQSLFDYPIICDDLANHQGPLAGFQKAMSVCPHEYLLVLPCDCPQVQIDLVRRLKECMQKSAAEICVAHDGRRMQPTFALLRMDLLGSLSAFLSSGGRKIDRWYAEHRTECVDFSDVPKFFQNLNQPKDYATLTAKTYIRQTPVIGFAAYSGTGKTTLITSLIKRLKSNNIRVGFVKHAHHKFDIDHKGKDSYEVYHSGAQQVLISSSSRFALINRYSESHPELELFELIKKLDLSKIDLVIVEGFKEDSIAKIELQRVDLAHDKLFLADERIIAVACDDVNLNCNRVVIDINDLDEVYGFVCAYAGLDGQAMQIASI